MGLLGCDSDSLSKPAGRGHDEKRDRAGESRGVEWGKRKPGPSYTTPTLWHSASAKTLMWSRWKLSVDFSLLLGSLPAFGGFTACPAVLQWGYRLQSWESLAETWTKDCWQNIAYVKSLGKRWIYFTQLWTDLFFSVDEWKGKHLWITGLTANPSTETSYLITTYTSYWIVTKKNLSTLDNLQEVTVGTLAWNISTVLSCQFCCWHEGKWKE